MSRYSCNFAAGNCSAACSIGSSLNILQPEYEQHYLTHVCTISLEIYIYTMWNCKYDIHCTCNLSVMMSLRSAFILKTPMFECLKTPMFQLMFWHQKFSSPFSQQFPCQDLPPRPRFPLLLSRDLHKLNDILRFLLCKISWWCKIIWIIRLLVNFYVFHVCSWFLFQTTSGKCAHIKLHAAHNSPKYDICHLQASLHLCHFCLQELICLFLIALANNFFCIWYFPFMTTDNILLQLVTFDYWLAAQQSYQSFSRSWWKSDEMCGGQGCKFPIEIISFK